MAGSINALMLEILQDIRIELLDEFDKNVLVKPRAEAMFTLIMPRRKNEPRRGTLSGAASSAPSRGPRAGGRVASRPSSIAGPCAAPSRARSAATA